MCKDRAEGMDYAAVQTPHTRAVALYSGDPKTGSPAPRRGVREADEVRHLTAIITHQASRIRELEDTVARAVAKGVQYREVQLYYDDAPRLVAPPGSDTPKQETQ